MDVLDILLAQRHGAIEVLGDKVSGGFLKNSFGGSTFESKIQIAHSDARHKHDV
jgi:hypothetical protein